MWMTPIVNLGPIVELFTILKFDLSCFQVLGMLNFMIIFFSFFDKVERFYDCIKILY